MSEVDVVVVAAGASARMGSVDKLFAPVGGRPLLGWTLAALADPALVRRIVVVASADRVPAALHQLDQMHAQLGFDDARRLSLPKTEDGALEFLDELAAPDETEVASLGC